MSCKCDPSLCPFQPLFLLSSLATLVKVMMALSVFSSYTVQFHVPVDIINSYIQERIAPDKHLKVEYLIRLVLALFTFSLAAGIPRLDLFISLVGSVSSSTLALMAPPIIDTVTAGEKCSRSLTFCLRIQNIFEY